MFIITPIIQLTGSRKGKLVVYTDMISLSFEKMTFIIHPKAKDADPALYTK